jgi:hypothetical protein
MPVIPATQEDEIGRSWIWGYPEQNYWDPYVKKKSKE